MKSCAFAIALLAWQLCSGMKENEKMPEKSPSKGFVLEEVADSLPNKENQKVKDEKRERLMNVEGKTLCKKDLESNPIDLLSTMKEYILIMIGKYLSPKERGLTFREINRKTRKIPYEPLEPLQMFLEEVGVNEPAREFINRKHLQFSDLQLYHSFAYVITFFLRYFNENWSKFSPKLSENGKSLLFVQFVHNEKTYFVSTVRLSFGDFLRVTYEPWGDEGVAVEVSYSDNDKPEGSYISIRPINYQKDCCTERFCEHENFEASFSLKGLNQLFQKASISEVQSFPSSIFKIQLEVKDKLQE